MNDAMDAAKRAVRGTLEAAGLWREGARLVVALSGGADSVALLHALCRVAPERELRVSACHVQHGLRGQSSREDERFVRALCKGLGVPLTVANARLCGGMEDAGAETRARAERMRIFGEEMRAQSADALLTAHHLDDQAETALMRLARGAGMDGLCAMRQVTPFAGGLMLKPFLTLPKQTLVDALKNDEGLCHREDESNQSPTTPRNALRLDVLPRLDALFPGVKRHIADAAESLQADENYLEAQSGVLYERALYSTGPIFALRKRALQSAPEALRRRALRRWYAQSLALRGLCPDERGLGHGDTLRLSALASAPYGESLNLPCDTQAFSGGEWLHLGRQGGKPLCDYAPPAPIPVTADVTEYRLSGVTLRLSACPPGATAPRDASAVWLSPALLARKLYLGTPMPGDAIRPFGAAGAKLLRRYLTDRKLDPPFRLSLPVLAAGSTVLWIPGLCSAEELRVTQPAQGMYELKLLGDAPYQIQPNPNR